MSEPNESQQPEDLELEETQAEGVRGGAAADLDTTTASSSLGTPKSAGSKTAAKPTTQPPA